MKKILLSLAAAVAALVLAKEVAFPILQSQANIGKQKAGFYLLPTNQLLRPWGEQAMIVGRPVDMTFDSGKRMLAILDTRSILINDGSTGAQFHELKSGRSTSFAGIAFRPGDREIWASETSRNGPDSILVVPVGEDGKPGKFVHLELKGHPVPCAIAFSADGKTVYVAFSRNNSVGVFDAESRTLKQEVPVGMAPFGVVVEQRTGQVFVSNRAGRRPQAGDTTAPSSGTDVVTDPVTGSTTTGTVSVIDAASLKVKDVTVGLAPAGLALSPDGASVVVTNAHSDSISILNTKTLARTDVKIPSYPEAPLGAQPDAAAFSPDGKRLYVACGGNNAIAVLEAQGKTWKLAGALPTGWFPSALAVARDGSLRVLNIKGTGNTANGKGQFNSRVYEGSLSAIPAPAQPQLSAGLREVQAANNPKFESAGGIANLPSLGIQHVFLIVKENRTYDQVFGDIAKGNGDANLAIFPREVTPNHHALADKYVLLDNFHTGGAISFDGHQWLMQGFVSDYVERAFAASPRGYAWNMADAMVVPPTGFFWQGTSKPLSLRIYGEFQMPAKFNPATQTVQDMNESEVLGWSEYWKAYKAGTWRTLVGSRSGVPALQPYCSRSYPFSSTFVPDQLRADDYLEEFAKREQSGDLPQLNLIHLNSDHTNGTRPGSPTPRAMVADNDLALGRIVEAISKSKFWSKSLILVVEDDAQDGLDHVDGHRTVAMAIGPHIRRNAVDSNHYNHTSMIRTVQNILSVPPRSKFLRNARAMSSIFTAQADTSPYKCLPANIPLDQMNPPLKALAGRQLWAARQSAAMNWNQPDDVPSDVLNRILWWDAKGYDRAYPK